MREVVETSRMSMTLQQLEVNHRKANTLSVKKKPGVNLSLGKEIVTSKKLVTLD